MTNDFAVFILTNNRPDNVVTYTTLKKQGYTGKIFIIIDDLDKTKDEYIANFGNKVIIFDKVAIAKTFDTGDNFNDMAAIVYARNASFKIAKELGLKYFIQLDDDYTFFSRRFNSNFEYGHIKLNTPLDIVFKIMIKFFIASGASSFAMAQGGDYIGGASSGMCFGKGLVGLRRKCMNFFICSTDRPFQFIGRINEDVNTYTRLASTGLLLFTTNQICLEQIQTQSNKGGMTELYLRSGTYIKSFYSVMYHPSSVKIRMMGSINYRLHHCVQWENTVPMIVSESIKKVI
jgi:hypothetical protein